jgi:hypothetical protein
MNKSQTSSTKTKLVKHKNQRETKSEQETQKHKLQQRIQKMSLA